MIFSPFSKFFLSSIIYCIYVSAIFFNYYYKTKRFIAFKKKNKFKKYLISVI